MKKILFVSGSARNGNCKYILEEIQKKFWLETSTEVIYLRDFDISPCFGCHACDKTEDHECVKGDKIHLAVGKILDAEIVVIATPNYFYNMSGLTKSFIDKTIPYYNTQELKNKKFIFIYTGEDSKENTKIYLDRAFEGFVDCHNINNLGSYAFSTSGINEFKDESDRDNTIEEICNLIRDNLLD